MRRGGKKAGSQREEKRELREGEKGEWEREGRPRSSDPTVIFQQREGDRKRERKQNSAKICFLVSMATAGYYSQLSFIMKGSDFSEGGREREREGERTDREVRPTVYLLE